MGESGSKQESNGNPQKLNVGMVFIIVALLLIVGMAIVTIGYFQKQAAASQAAIARQQANTDLGIPRDYPSDIVPVYKGLTILSTERDSAISTEGEPMDKWVINGEIDAKKEPVKEFYSNLLIESGFSQQHFVGLPTGYGLKYANEICSVDLTIEFRPPGELLKVDIVMHKLRD